MRRFFQGGVLIGFSVLLFVLVALLFTTNNQSNETGEAVAIIVSVILNIVPMVCYIPFGVLFCVLSVLLMLKKWQHGFNIIALVLLCIMFPIFIFSLYANLFVIGQYNIGILVVSIFALLLYIAALVLTILEVRSTKSRPASLDPVSAVEDK